MISATELEQKLTTVFSPKQISPSQDGLPTTLTVFPKQTEQVCDLIRLACTDGITLLPLGGGTRLYPGERPMDIAVSLTRMKGKSFHSPVDLIATFPAGLSFMEAQARLSKRGQMIPLDPFLTPSSTVGGVISANASGPRRHRYGTARDWVIATTVANGDGFVARAGAKVVKNVSGYDMNKLYVGARGTLGILLDISFKLFPIPESRVTFRSYHLLLQEALDFALSISKTPFDMEALVVLKGGWTPESNKHWLTLVELAGPRKGIEPQVVALSSLHDRAVPGKWQITPEKEASILWKAANDPDPWNDELGTNQRLRVRLMVSRTRVQDVVYDLISYEKSDLWFKIFPTAGICYLSFPANDKASANLRQHLTDKVRACGGILEFESLPEDSEAERWPILPPSFPWMHRIKKVLDPHSIFAPGTFVGGI